MFLISGQTYLISMRGTGGTPLDDSYIEIYNPTGGFVTFDDDGGTSRNSLVTFTATATGNYEIDAQAFGIGAADIGGYTVDVRVQGVDAVGFTNATSVPLSLGVTFGFREFGTGSQSFNPVLDGDTDMYAVTLQAGHFYTFEVASGWDGEAQTPGINAMNPVIVLYNAAGQVVQRGTAQNDNIGSDLSSALGTTITDNGTYYLQVSHRVNQTGGYVINFQDVDFAGLSPLDTINWFDADNIDTVNVAGVPTAYVYFGAAGDDFDEGLTTLGWNATEKAAVMTALIEFTKITGIQYLETSIIGEAEFRLNTINDAAAPFGAYFYPQDPGFGDAEGIGIFNKISGGWTIEPSPGVQPSLERGGYSFAVILHEFGHGHGLAHPHDNGGSSDIMPGMFAANGNGTFSVYNMAQGVYTVMSYNDAWRFHPDGNSPFTVAGIDNGWSASLSAFDIAVLQDRYGVHAYNTGNNVYTLTDVVDDAFYECIWDSGGTDSIAYAGALSAIDRPHRGDARLFADRRRRDVLPGRRRRRAAFARRLHHRQRRGHRECLDRQRQRPAGRQQRRQRSQRQWRRRPVHRPGRRRRHPWRCRVGHRFLSGQPERLHDQRGPHQRRDHRLHGAGRQYRGPGQFEQSDRRGQ